MDGKTVSTTNGIGLAFDKTANGLCENEEKVDGVMLQTNFSIRINDDGII